MTEQRSGPQPGQLYYDSEGTETEITEVVGPEDEELERWRVTDEDGDEAVIKWNADEERWEVDA